MRYFIALLFSVFCLSVSLVNAETLKDTNSTKIITELIKQEQYVQHHKNEQDFIKFYENLYSVTGGMKTFNSVLNDCSIKASFLLTLSDGELGCSNEINYTYLYKTYGKVLSPNLKEYLKLMMFESKIKEKYQTTYYVDGAVAFNRKERAILLIKQSHYLLN